MPGSFIDTVFGGTGRLGDRFFRGSGTSQAAAITSGVAALILSRRPDLTPDQVKNLITVDGEAGRRRAGAEQGSGRTQRTERRNEPVRGSPVAAALHTLEGQRDARGRPRQLSTSPWITPR